MIQLTRHMRILVAIEPADFRKGIDGLAAVCRGYLHEDPFTGTVFVFRNRRATTVKIICYDGQGFWLCQKRLSKGHFAHWPVSLTQVDRLEAHQLMVLLSGGNPAAARGAESWRALPLNG